MKSKDLQEWEKYWSTHQSSLFGNISSIYRKYLLSRYVKRILDLHFDREGFFVDCGSGSAESSMRLEKSGRDYLALDFSYEAVRDTVKKFGHLRGICGDIFHLPFRDETIEGIYNLGVMEHFYQGDIVAIMKEFHRVLRKDSCIVLFWPCEYGFSQLVLDSISFFLNKVCRIAFWYTPAERTRLRSKEHAQSIVKKTDFQIEKIYFSWGDLFTHYVVVARKADSNIMKLSRLGKRFIPILMSLNSSIRRRYLFYFRRGYVEQMLRTRKGSCEGCGCICCIRTRHCPFVKDGKCAIYNTNIPKFCKIFPIDERDIELAEVKDVCQFYWEKGK